METFNTRIPRELAVQYGEQAVQIIRAGTYRTPSGRIVSIADLGQGKHQEGAIVAAIEHILSVRIGGNP